MKIYSIGNAPIIFTSKDNQEAGKVEYSNKYFFEQERNALKSQFADVFNFEDLGNVIEGDKRKSPKELINVVSEITHKIKK